MKYISTRGDTTQRGFCDILLEGLAPDGGLYMPVAYPKVDTVLLEKLRKVYFSKVMPNLLLKFCHCILMIFQPKI